MAQLLEIPEKELCHFLISIEKNVYLDYQPKPNGELRQITKPSKRLKEILRKIKSLILEQLPLHQLLYHKPRSSYLELIKNHQTDTYLLTSDIDDFFPSIRPKLVQERLIEEGITKSVANILTRFCTVNYSLPQGFPTSSIIASIALKPVMTRLEGLTKQAHLRAGVYADNLAISCNYDPQKFKNLIEKIFRQNGFRLEKITIMSPNDCHEIMKIIIFKDKLSVKQDYRREIKKDIMIIAKKVKAESRAHNFDELKRIRGKLAYVHQVNIQQARALKEYAMKLGIKL